MQSMLHSASDISWQDTANAVGAAVFVLVKKCKQNKDDWVCEFLRRRFKEELGRLPARTSADEREEEEANDRSVRPRLHA